MNPHNFKIHQLTKSSAEMAELQKICTDWQFWRYDQVLELLENKNNILYYVKSPAEDQGDKLLKPQSWLGVALYAKQADSADLLYVFIRKRVEFTVVAANF